MISGVRADAFVEAPAGGLPLTVRKAVMLSEFGGSVTVIRDAVLDLSGFYASAGIKITF